MVGWVLDKNAEILRTHADVAFACLRSQVHSTLCASSSFISLWQRGEGRHTHTHTLPASASQSHSRIVQSSTYWSQGPWYLVDVLYSRPPSPVHLSRRSKLQKTNCLKRSVERSGGQSGRRTAKRMWRGGTLTFVCEREKMLGETEQQTISLFLCGSPPLPLFLSILLSPSRLLSSL